MSGLYLDLDVDIHAILFREADCLDDGRWEEWLSMYSEDCSYWVPARPGQTDPTSEVSIAFDDRQRLEQRIVRMQHKRAHALRPPPETIRIVGNIAVDEALQDEVRIRSAMLLHVHFRASTTEAPEASNLTEIVSARVGHTLVRYEDEWKIQRKVVRLLGSDQPQSHLNYLL